MDNYVYLDWASTAPVHYFAKDYYIPGNPNSNHAMGLQANQALNEARQRIMDYLGVKSGKVLFCRCATEAVEWLCRQFRDGCVYVYPFEHDSTYALGKPAQGIFPGYYNLYLHQYVNQLTGTVFNIESIGKQVKSVGGYFGSDFTATIGHYPIPDNLDSFCSVVWFSGHKFGCEPGIGTVWLSDRLFKYLGGSEDSRNNYGLLHGTPNVSAAVAMSYAMEHAVRYAQIENDWYHGLVDYMLAKLNKANIEIGLLEKDKPKTYAINALYLHNINGDALTQYLSSKSIYISPGHSACSNDTNDATRVLEAFGLTKQEASQTVRVSFGEDSTQEDVNVLVNGIVEFKEMFV